MRWVLLLRAVNLGPNNKIAMSDLAELLRGLGHTEVRTYLNSGNATFASPSGSAATLAADIEAALRDSRGLVVRACVRSEAELRSVLDELPDLEGYVVCNILFEKPTAQALQDFLATDWSPEVVQGNAEVLYVAFVNAGKTKLTNGKIERALGVSCTARTPATLRKLLP